jgi:hypothetical protein
MDHVNERLNYLVVGDVPSPGWKHGSYGRKILAARALSAHNGPQIVSEGSFMEALAAFPPHDSGSIDSKVLVCNYKFLTESRSRVDVTAFEHLLEQLQHDGWHVVVKTHWAAAYAELFGTLYESPAPGALVIECRMVMPISLNANPAPIVEAIERRFESIDGVDGRLSWFERVEGSADYVRLIRELPNSLTMSPA